MAEKPLEEQVSIVTGASHGIGSAIARRLAELGAQVIVAARSAPRLQELASDIQQAGGRAHAVAADVRSPAGIEHLIHSSIQTFGQVDILVNNAGIGSFGAPLHETDLETWEATMETNLRSAYVAIRALAPHLIQRRCGHIINIGSLAGHNPVPNAAAYAASKWGLRGLTMSAAEELRGFGIRVSLISPGSVDTGLSPELTRNKARERMLRPEDVAHAVATLVTQAPASFISEIQIRPTLKP